MGLLPDVEIMRLWSECGMIQPFVAGQVRERGGKPCTSFGLSSYGYDVRIANRFKVFTDLYSTIVDPHDFDSSSVVEIEGPECLIPPHSFVLGVTVERFRMPPDVVGFTACKSTLIRCGILVPFTVLEPGWEGYLTLEISNTTPLPARIYAGEGIAQVTFWRGDGPCAVSYAARDGKYQGQGALPVEAKV